MATVSGDTGVRVPGTVLLGVLKAPRSAVNWSLSGWQHTRRQQGEGAAPVGIAEGFGYSGKQRRPIDCDRRPDWKPQSDDHSRKTGGGGSGRDRYVLLVLDGMVDMTLKWSEVEEYLDSHELTVIRADGFDDCVIGITDIPDLDETVLVYSQQACVRELQKGAGMSRSEAWEYFNFNTLRASCGPGTPLFVDVIGSEDFYDHCN